MNNATANRESQTETRDFAVVIPARNEAVALEATLQSLADLLPSRMAIHVIADHCEDRTAAVASAAGVHLHVRTGTLPLGKGPALAWWLERTCADSNPSQTVIILDADSRVDRSFFDGVLKRLNSVHSVIQTRVRPISSPGSPLSELAALSETVEQLVFERVRAALGWPARLRGTGMAFRRAVFAPFAPLLKTISEDAELSVLLAAAGIRAHFAHDLAVFDPKPADRKGAANQRSRWLKGQIQVLFAHPQAILSLLARGPAGWSLLIAIFAKPKSLFLPLQLLAFVLIGAPGRFLASPSFTQTLALGAAMLVVLANSLALLYGITASDDRRRTARALIAAPSYPLMWLMSLIMALSQKERWPRSRPTAVEPRGREASVVG